MVCKAVTPKNWEWVGVRDGGEPHPPSFSFALPWWVLSYFWNAPSSARYRHSFICQKKSRSVFSPWNFAMKIQILVISNHFLTTSNLQVGTSKINCAEVKHIVAAFLGDASSGDWSIEVLGCQMVWFHGCLSLVLSFTGFGTHDLVI